MFAGYLIASIWASYHIAKTVNKEIPKAKAGGKYIMSIAIVSLFVLPIILDSLFLVDALKFIYYKLYMKDLQLHVNVTKLATPDFHFGAFYTLLIAMISTLCLYLIAPFVTARVMKLSKKNSLN